VHLAWAALVKNERARVEVKRDLHHHRLVISEFLTAGTWARCLVHGSRGLAWVVEGTDFGFALNLAAGTTYWLMQTLGLLEGNWSEMSGRHSSDLTARTPRTENQ